MTFSTLLVAGAVAGATLLWRTYRYDSDVAFNAYLNRLPYYFQKPITCGICITFWLSLAATIIFSPLKNAVMAVPSRFTLPQDLATIIGFGLEWLFLGMIAAAIVYAIDTVFHVSHYFRHAAHPHDSHP